MTTSSSTSGRPQPPRSAYLICPLLGAREVRLTGLRLDVELFDHPQAAGRKVEVKAERLGENAVAVGTRASLGHAFWAAWANHKAVRDTAPWISKVRR
jgi:hypothetical protein